MHPRTDSKSVTATALAATRHALGVTTATWSSGSCSTTTVSPPKTAATRAAVAADATVFIALTAADATTVAAYRTTTVLSATAVAVASTIAATVAVAFTTSTTVAAASPTAWDSASRLWRPSSVHAYRHALRDHRQGKRQAGLTARAGRTRTPAPTAARDWAAC